MECERGAESVAAASPEPTHPSCVQHIRVLYKDMNSVFVKFVLSCRGLSEGIVYLF